MKLFCALAAVTVLLVAPAASVTLGGAPTARASSSASEDDSEKIERRVAVEPTVTVALCVASGDVIVRGWDRREVRARSADAGQLQLKLIESPNRAEAVAGGRVEVLVSDDEKDNVSAGACGGSAGIELDVPRGANVVLKVGSGDLDVSEVATAHLRSGGGGIEVRNVTGCLDVVTISGNIFLKGSGGPVRLRTVGGDIEASDARTTATGDVFSVSTTSGGITLVDVAHTRVDASSTSGDVHMTGTLARGGVYRFKSHSGNVTLELPGDASFNVNARVVMDGEIITDFPVRSQGGPAPLTGFSAGRLTGSVGQGDAEVNLSSFNGTLYLRKKQ